jgi:hypothetical protein
MCPYDIHCICYGSVFVSCVTMWFEYPELLLLFLIACICSLYLVRNAVPVFLTYLSHHKEKRTRRILTDVARRRQRAEFKIRFGVPGLFTVVMLFQSRQSCRICGDFSDKLQSWHDNTLCIFRSKPLSTRSLPIHHS